MHTKHSAHGNYCQYQQNISCTKQRTTLHCRAHQIMTTTTSQL